MASQASMVNMANIANLGANYRPRGIGLKKQLTETKFLAFSPWK